MKKKIIFYAAAFGMLSACSEIPSATHFNRGAPESLLDVSSEVVSLQLTSEKSVDELVGWVDKDQPTRAELHCSGSSPMCKAAKDALKLYGVTYEVTDAGADNSVDLIYERVLSRDCDNRFMDNHINPYNMNHPTFGCSVASNIVQSVTDKKEFTDPALLGLRDAKKAMHDVRDYHDDADRAQQKQAKDSKYSVQELKLD